MSHSSVELNFYNILRNPFVLGALEFDHRIGLHRKHTRLTCDPWCDMRGIQDADAIIAERIRVHSCIDIVAEVQDIYRSSILMDRLNLSMGKLRLSREVQRHEWAAGPI